MHGRRTTALAILVVFAVGCGQRTTPARPATIHADVRAEIEQAETAERARKHDVARSHYERAVAAARDPLSIAYARRAYAETLITWGEYPTATVQLEGALAARDDDAASWHDLGHLRLNANDTRGAITAFERSMALAPKDVRPRKSLAAALWKTGDLAGALVQYKAMLELDLPDADRVAVQWAVAAIPAIQRGETPPPPPKRARQR